MWKTNLRVLAVAVIVLGFYTGIAQIIPQLQSEVPATIDLSAGVTPDALVSAGSDLFNGAGGCTACHGLGTRAPNLLTDQGGQGPIGARCGARKPGMDCKAYLYESLTQPTAFLVDGFPPIMIDVRRQLSDDQIWAIIAFLQSQGGEVTVTADDLNSTAETTTAAAGGGGGGGFSSSKDPMELLTANACLGCHGIDGNVVNIGPPFDGIGSRLTADQIRHSILDPSAEVSPGYESFAGMMPTTLADQLSAAQLEIIVQFLAGRK